MTDGGQPAELRWSAVEHYLAEALETSYRLSRADTRPVVQYEVVDDGRDIALFVELEPGQRPPQSRLPAVDIDQVSHRGLRMARIRTSQPSLLRDFHDLVIAIADRINTGSSLNVAFVETVRSWNALLNEQRAAALQKRLGLHGELAVLRQLAGSFGWDVAMQSWTGPANEERDFVLPKFDIEVKTTSSERRRHAVHGFRQLEPSLGRPLWFTSIRLTRGGASGRLLAESVEAIRMTATNESSDAGERFASLLSEAGWNQDHYDDERWALRDSPLVLESEQVPRSQFDRLSTHSKDRIMSLQYEIDVTGLPPSNNAPLDAPTLRLP